MNVNDDVFQNMNEAILRAIDERKQTGKRFVVAIDGRSASGKTSLALQLGERLGTSVIHMDHFFLRAEQRTDERRAEPGGNIDYERFATDVLEPLSQELPFEYRPFDCKTMAFGNPIPVELTDVVIIEGAYACHPRFRDHYDLRVFLSVDSTTQIARIRERNGEQFTKMFTDLWIPLEERYIEYFQIPEHCDLVLDSSNP